MLSDVRLHTQVALCLALLAPAFAENSVHIRSTFGQLVTSSTLQWVAGEPGSHQENAVVGAHQIVEADSVDGEEDVAEVKKLPVVVCRANHNGMWVSGELRPEDKTCTVSFLGTKKSYERYQVLQNVDDGARLSWFRWNKFHVVPAGAVACGDGVGTFVARRRVGSNEASNTADNSNIDGILGFTHHVGKLDPKDGLGKISIVNENGDEQHFTDGEVLMETEPVRYELTGLKFDQWRRRKVSRTPRVLASNVLSNGAATFPVHVDSALAYDSEYSLYWGQGKAILKGLPTSARFANGTLIGDFKWGIAETEQRKDVYRVDYLLDPGTAVNVTLHGNHTESEVPYTGKLVAVYADDYTKARTINGSRREVAMLDVKPEFGPVYFIGNGSLVPTTTTTTTTSTTTTTTTEAANTIPKTLSTPQQKKQKKPVDENSDHVVKTGDTQSMLSDGSGAHSLKNKQERGFTGSGTTDRAVCSMVYVVSSALLLFTYTGIARRIT